MENDQELDPEIAELLGIEPEEEKVVEEEEKEEIAIEADSDIVKPVPKREILPININKILSDKNLYTKIIDEAKESGRRVHDLISNFFKADEKDEKSMYREKLIPAYWNMLTFLIDSFFDNLTDEMKALYRYGLLSNSFIDEKQKGILFGISEKSNLSYDFYYIDEWLLMIGNGKIKQSSVDETVKAKKQSPSVLKDKLDRKLGSKEAELANLKQKIEQHLMIEKSLKSSVSIILNHDTRHEYENAIAPYNIEQKKTISQIQDILKNLLKSNRDIEDTYNTLKSLKDDIRSLSTKGGEVTDIIDTKTVKDEFFVIRQMVKMTVGRQGNHFPFLTKTYMPRIEKDVCTKNNLEMAIKEIEEVDPGIFKRMYKQKEHRIVPYFIIVPSYGDYGICWEPFDRMNKATSKGRIAVPMFPRDLKTAILYAFGDLRWQIAKEKALHYWMEEGLTGHYYEYTQKNKLKGDLKEYFIQDYILWVLFESRAVQKLSKEVRSIFWRHIPFPQGIKEDLRNRGFYYAELYKKDKTREMSRGY